MVVGSQVAGSQVAGAPPTVTTLLPGYMLSSDQGEFAFCAVNLIEGRDEAGELVRIVVDTGHVGRHRALEEALAAHGLAPGDIDAVLLTHAHWDHVQNVGLFERATVLAHPDELRYVRSPHPKDHATPLWTGAILERRPLREVSEGTELLPGVTVLDTPGHSPGTIAVAVATDLGTAVLTGDAIQDGQVAQEGRNALVFWDEKAANDSVRKILDVADLVYPGHDRAFRLRGDGQVDYLEQLEITLRYAAPGLPGLGFDLCRDRQPVIMPSATPAG